MGAGATVADGARRLARGRGWPACRGSGKARQGVRGPQKQEEDQTRCCRSGRGGDNRSGGADGGRPAYRGGTFASSAGSVTHDIGTSSREGSLPPCTHLIASHECTTCGRPISILSCAVARSCTQASARSDQCPPTAELDWPSDVHPPSIHNSSALRARCSPTCTVPPAGPSGQPPLAPPRRTREAEPLAVLAPLATSTRAAPSRRETWFRDCLWRWT